MSKESTIGSAIDEAINYGKRMAKGEFHNHSTDAINKIGSGIANFTGVLEAAGGIIKGEGFNESIARTFGKAPKEVIKNGKKVVEPNGWKVGKIAGSYLGAATAYRVASGGGLYKDKDGNTNIIGVPFI